MNAYNKCEGCYFGLESHDAEGAFYRCQRGDNPTTCDPDPAVHPKCELIAYTPNPLRVIETAAAICYDSNPKETGSLARKCYQSGHLSVFEHAYFTFRVSGVSRVLLAQITRHRHASFSVRSQRYCDEDRFRYVLPPSMADAGEDTESAFRASMQISGMLYDGYLVNGVPQEDARYQIPQGIETKFIVSMNARSLMHLCNLRLCSRAQWEIRRLVQMMRDAVVRACPEFDPYLVPQCEVHAPYNFCPEAKSCGKHPRLKDVYREEMLHAKVP